MSYRDTTEPAVMTEAEKAMSLSQQQPQTPPLGPMAFTIDLDDLDGGNSGGGKRLGLKDGIKHFAPFKRKEPPPPPVKTKPPQSRSSPTASASDRENNNNNNSNSPRGIVSSAVDKPAVASATAKGDNDDGGSETGTYTIDDDESLKSERGKIETVFSVERQSNSRDWVSQWAASTGGGLGRPRSPSGTTTGCGSDSPGSSIDREEGSRSRRRLPATPAVVAAAAAASGDAGRPSRQQSSMVAETQNFLQDTISVMEAMEARIGEDKRRAMTTTTTTRTTKTKVTVALTEQEERKMAWERRKNYDPLRAVGRKQSVESNCNGRGNGDGRFHPSDTDTDTFSEIEQNSLTIRENAPFATSAARSKGLPSTRPNRAFALRKKLNQTDDSSISSPPPVNSSSPAAGGGGGLARGDGGRFSLRGAKTHHGVTPPTRKAMVSKTMSDTARSSSSLSSKEAEFQAWKRRKNYNPLVASGLAQGRKSPRVTSPPAALTVAAAASGEQYRIVTNNNAPLPPPQRGTNHKSKLMTTSVAAAAASAVANGSDAAATPMQRSASFHYPDGLSRVQHNVYSSEDESPDDLGCGGGGDWERSDLFELNDDELILPIGGKLYRPPSKSSSSSGLRGGGSSGSGPSAGRMEALDNLVISTIYSVSTKLCLNSASLIRRVQDRVVNEEQHAIMDTLVYVLEDTDPPASPSKKTSRELAGTLRNLKKVEQALQVFEASCFDGEEDNHIYGGNDEDEDADDENNK